MDPPCWEGWKRRVEGWPGPPGDILGASTHVFPGEPPDGAVCSSSQPTRPHRACKAVCGPACRSALSQCV